MSDTWWWGAYPETEAASARRAGEGIWVMSPDGPAVLAIELPAPAYVVAHPDLPVLYAVSDVERAELVCLDVSDVARPAVLDRVATGASGARHLLLSRDTLTAYVTHGPTGEVAVVPLRTDGRIATEAPTQLLRARAGFVGYAPAGPVLLSCDRAADTIERHAVLAGGSLRADGVAAALPPGSGPHRFVTRNDVIYVACERDNTLAALRWDPTSRIATLFASTPIAPVPSRRGDATRAAHLVAVSGVVLVSVVGSDVISVVDLGGDGVPTYRASFDSGGAFPRYFAVTGERLVVANQASGAVSVFDLADVLALDATDEPDGFSVLAHADVAVPSAACVAFG